MNRIFAIACFLMVGPIGLCRAIMIPWRKPASRLRKSFGTGRRKKMHSPGSILGVELLVSTQDQKYADFLVEMTEEISEHIDRVGWIVGRSLPLVENETYRNSVQEAVKACKTQIDEQENKILTVCLISLISGEPAGVFRVLE